MKFRQLILATAVAVTLAGCVATDLSQLNAKYETLIQRKSDLARRSSTGPLDVAIERDREEVSAGLRAVTSEATTAGDKAGETATKVVAYRLAAVTAWQSGEAFDGIRNKGLDACKLLGNSSGAPRDCAILAYLPVLASYDQLVGQYKKALASRDYTSGVAMMSNVVSGSQTLVDGQLGPPNILSQIVTGKGSGYFAGVAPATQDYFRKVALATACLVDSTITYGREAAIKDSKSGGAGLIASAKTMSARFVPVLNAAGITDPPESVCR